MEFFNQNNAIAIIRVHIQIGPGKLISKNCLKKWTKA